jgi:secreted effector protein SseD
MVKAILLVTSCMLAMACNSMAMAEARPKLTGDTASAPGGAGKQTQRQRAKRAAGCAEAAKRAAEAETGAAVVGGALSMIGGFGGFGGRGGAIAGSVASQGGALIQQHAGNQARAGMVGCQ